MAIELPDARMLSDEVLEALRLRALRGRELGFTEADIADGGSDALIDTIVPQGTAEQLARALSEHLDAGADHVCIQPVTTDIERGMRELAELSPNP